MCIRKRLEGKFLEILAGHSNPKWAREELDYLVFVKHYNEFSQLNWDEQMEVRDYMEALKKIHGGK